MMERTRIFSALNGVRGRKPTNVPALEQVLIRFSQLVVDQPWISEININPLFVSAERIYALDARVVLHPPGTRQGDLPRPAIRPYPTQYVAPWKLKDKTSVLIRPIRPEDEPLMVKFHESLSAQSVYGRYYKELQLSQRVAHERLIRICFNDYDREVALVAEHRLPRTNEPQILGIGRLSKTRGANEAEFALIVSDHWQNQGLGTELLKRLVQVAREERLDRMVGRVVKENHAIQRICKSAGFHLHQENATGAWKAEIDL
jgi:acetyltransferase